MVKKFKSDKKITINDLNLDNQLVEKINRFAPIKYILKNQSDDDQKVIEILVKELKTAMVLCGETDVKNLSKRNLY